MKIAHIETGVIPTDSGGWGGVERIIWNLKIQFEKLGHEVYLTHTGDPRLKEGFFDIVHVYIENQARELADQGIKYIFWMCDHHAYIHGPKSLVYQRNCFAIDHSDITFFPAEFLISYFQFRPNTMFMPVGVDTEKYCPSYNNDKKNVKLICVANNGIIGNAGEDRKGFNFAIKAAEKLNLPITICGPTNSNKEFFRLNPQNYSKLNIIYDLNEEQMINEVNNHNIFLHPSSIETGHPNLTMVEALSMGLPVIGTYWGADIPGVFKVDRNVDEIVNKINFVSQNLEEYSFIARRSALDFDWFRIGQKLLKVYYEYLNNEHRYSLFTINSKENFSNRLKYIYDTNYECIHDNIKIELKTKPEFIINFCDGAYVEIQNRPEKLNKIIFYDQENNEKIYDALIGNNSWAKINRKWASKCKIEVIDTDTKDLLLTHKYNCEGKRVYIAFESSSLGDTIAWIPYVEKFREVNNCIVITSTFYNKLFEKEYKDIQFVNPGDRVGNLYALFRLGIFDPRDRSVHKSDPRTIPLQKVASDMLGLEFEEIRPKIYLENKNIINEKIVCIGPESTAAAKLWQRPDGWQDVINYLNKLDYKVYSLSEQYDNLENVIKINNRPIEDIINLIYNSEFFIGLGSGLSWIAWALNKPVIMISGFSHTWCEFSNEHRIINKNVCHGCFNDSRYEFNRGDWNWCPVNKNTENQFICTKSISPEMVIKEIDKIRNK